LRVDPGFTELFETEYATVFRAVCALCGDRTVAEDATQEAFARCLERWKRLGGQPWVAGWVTTTALNVARRAMRSQPQPARSHPGPDDLEAAIDLWMAIRMLPARQQEAVALHYAMDLPLKDVGEAMGCEEGTVKSHLARARESLRHLLEGEPVEG
jgi:RNA polymerase sigma-70 factor (ECF subfamily)